VSKTVAIREYKLKQKDLDKLNYCDESNPHGGRMRRYRLSQVQALAGKRPEANAGVDWAACASEVRKAETDDFRELLRIGHLDPARHLRFADWSGISFRNCDLRGCDFTGARLHNCDFTDALIDGARFDQAEIRDANLKAARDWKAHVRHWTRPLKAALNTDRSLPLFEPFQDAPFAPVMVVVPAGSFLMGSPADEPDHYENQGPQHEVTITKPFAIGRFAVTFAEWDAAQEDKDWRPVTGLAPRKPKDFGWGRGDRPVIDVSWDDAEAYTKWLSHKTGKDYGLPSEAEWEYACRAGTATPFWWGKSITPEQANYDGNYPYDGGEKGEYRGKTLPVKSFEPNPWGLYQMHGNVWEWCADGLRSYTAEPVPDPVGPLKDALRALRGGSWNDGASYVRAANRYESVRGSRLLLIGFRCRA
jgi:formylglycine-generating enzyme required for sulfatase activity